MDPPGGFNGVVDRGQHGRNVMLVMIDRHRVICRLLRSRTVVTIGVPMLGPVHHNINNTR